MSDLPFIPQYTPLIGDAETQAVTDYMRQGGWLTEFKVTERFAEAIAAYTGAGFCSIVSNGTVSLTAAVVAMGIGRGDEVVVPDYTMVATPNAVALAGARPVFCDVEADTLCMDVERLRDVVTERTAAVMLVSVNGRYPRGLEALMSFCEGRGIAVIEDAAQSLGSFLGEIHAGRLGAIGSFSFSMPKIITTGQGGALVTDDEALHRRITRIRDFGRDAPGNDDYQAVGWNFKFTDLQAAVGLAQMQTLPERVERKKGVYRRYTEGLADAEHVELIQTDLTDTTPWLVDVLVPDREGLIAHLRERGIGSRAFYPALHACPAYGLEGEFPVTTSIAARGLWLPSAMDLDEASIDRVCEAVRDYRPGSG